MFDGTLQVESVSRDFWRVTHDFTWRGEITATIPTGFHTDFASIPGFAALLGFDDDDYAEAATLHDWLYSTQIYSRATADRQFLLALADTGCGFVHRWVMWAILRVFGWWAWRQHTRENRRKRLSASIQNSQPKP